MENSLKEIDFQCNVAAMVPQELLPETKEEAGTSSAIYLDDDGKCLASLSPSEPAGIFCAPIFRARQMSYPANVDDKTCKFLRTIMSIREIKGHEARESAIVRIASDLTKAKLGAKAAPLFEELISLVAGSDSHVVMSSLVEAIGDADLGCEVGPFLKLLDIRIISQADKYSFSSQSYLGKIASVLGATERGQGAIPLFERMFSLAKKLPNKDYMYDAIGSIALAVPTAVKWPYARRFLDDMEVFIRTNSRHSDLNRIEVLGSIAAAYGKLGDVSATFIFDETIALLEESVAHRKEKGGAIWGVSSLWNNLARSGLESHLLAPRFKKLIAIGSSLPLEMYSGAYIARFYDPYEIERAGLGEHAFDVLKDIIDSARSRGLNSGRLLIEIAGSSRKMVTDEQYPQLIATLIGAIGAIENDHARIKAFLDIALFLNREGLKNTAIDTLKDAMSSASQIEFEPFRSDAYQNIERVIGGLRLGDEGRELLANLAEIQ